MDSQELAEMAHHHKHGRPETTKGPYYHHTWWESYKGAVKGILGGIVAGGVIGVLAGGAILGALTLLTVEVAPFAGIILASTTLFGMIEGKSKFEHVGIATGAVAASAEVSEVRMKEYVRGKFTELTNEIREMKAAMAGKKSTDSLQTDPAQPDTSPILSDADYRTTHCDEHCAPEDSKLVFWKVAGVGALVGAAVAAVMVLSGAAGGILEPVIGHGVVNTAATNSAILMAGAAFGASFGINRDVFRKIFDVTDCWFMGKLETGRAPGVGKSHSASVEPHAQASAATHKPSHREASFIAPQSYQPHTPTATVSDSFIVDQQHTIFRDKILAEQAQRALHSIDPTTAVRN